MFFLFLEYDLKYFEVSLRKFALKQLSIKTHDFFTDDPKEFIPGIPAGAWVQIHYL